MTVTGTEQRVYGTLTASGSCLIDLHRFALVSGSTTLSPPEATTVTYADTTPYKQCGYKYSGYITLFLSISGTSVYAAVEVRICKNDPKRIVIETYGEVAKTVTGGMSLWFNKGSETSPDWVKLNSTTSGVIMPYATTSYTFKESKRNGSTTIDCCKTCPDNCGCKTCNLPLAISVHFQYGAGEDLVNLLDPLPTVKTDPRLSYPTRTSLTAYTYDIYNNGGDMSWIGRWELSSVPNGVIELYIAYKLYCDKITVFSSLVRGSEYLYSNCAYIFVGQINNWVVSDYVLMNYGNGVTGHQDIMIPRSFDIPFDYLKNCVGVNNLTALCLDRLTFTSKLDACITVGTQMYLYAENILGLPNWDAYSNLRYKFKVAEIISDTVIRVDNIIPYTMLSGLNPNGTINPIIQTITNTYQTMYNSVDLGLDYSICTGAVNCLKFDFGFSNIKVERFVNGEWVDDFPNLIISICDNTSTIYTGPFTSSISFTDVVHTLVHPYWQSSMKIRLTLQLRNAAWVQFRYTVTLNTISITCPHKTLDLSLGTYLGIPTSNESDGYAAYGIVYTEPTPP